MSNINLLSTVPGKFYRIIEITGGHGLQKRLQDLGIVPGTEIEIIQNDKRHPLLIRANGTVMMIGKGIAKKIVAYEITNMQHMSNDYIAAEKKGEYNQ